MIGGVFVSGALGQPSGPCEPSLAEAHGTPVSTTWEDSFMCFHSALVMAACLSPAMAPAPNPVVIQQQLTIQDSGDLVSPTFTSTLDFASSGHLQSYMAEGCWTKEELANNINWLELRAVNLALHHFKDIV